MDKNLQKNLPVGLVGIALIFQYNLFVTPEKLEVKHREILSDISQTYTTKEQYNDLRSQLTAMQAKIDKIYDVVINGGKNNADNKYWIWGFGKFRNTK